jgi:hypothetical protein
LISIKDAYDECPDFKDWIDEDILRYSCYWNYSGGVHIPLDSLNYCNPGSCGLAYDWQHESDSEPVGGYNCGLNVIERRGVNNQSGESDVFRSGGSNDWVRPGQYNLTTDGIDKIYVVSEKNDGGVVVNYRLYADIVENNEPHYAVFTISLTGEVNKISINGGYSPSYDDGNDLIVYDRSEGINIGEDILPAFVDFDNWYSSMQSKAAALGGSYLGSHRLLRK